MERAAGMSELAKRRDDACGVKLAPTCQFVMDCEAGRALVLRSTSAVDVFQRYAQFCRFDCGVSRDHNVYTSHTTKGM